MVEEKYESKAKVTKISGVSRAAVRIEDASHNFNFYTFEVGMEKIIPENAEDIDIQAEYDILFNQINDEVDYRITEVEDSYEKECFSKEVNK